MQPDAVTPIALNGLLQKKAVIVPGKVNRTLLFLDRLLPRFIVKFFEDRTMKRLQTPRPPAETRAENTKPLSPYGEVMLPSLIYHAKPFYHANV